MQRHGLGDRLPRWGFGNLIVRLDWPTLAVLRPSVSFACAVCTLSFPPAHVVTYAPAVPKFELTSHVCTVYAYDTTVHTRKQYSSFGPRY